MPALQVREFPDELYAKLKDLAALQHRSVAQQTIVAVEQMVDACELDVQNQQAERRVHVVPTQCSYEPISNEPDIERENRIEKRKKLFAEFDAVEWIGPKPSADEMVQMVHEGRDERDARVLEYDENEEAAKRESGEAR